MQSIQISAHGMVMHQRMITHMDIVEKVSVHMGCEETPNILLRRTASVLRFFPRPERLQQRFAVLADRKSVV